MKWSSLHESMSKFSPKKYYWIGARSQCSKTFFEVNFALFLASQGVLKEYKMCVVIMNGLVYIKDCVYLVLFWQVLRGNTYKTFLE